MTYIGLLPTRHYHNLSIDQIKESITFTVKQRGYRSRDYLYHTKDGDCISLSYCWEDEKWNCYSLMTLKDFNQGVNND